MKKKLTTPTQELFADTARIKLSFKTLAALEKAMWQMYQETKNKLAQYTCYLLHEILCEAHEPITKI